MAQVVLATLPQLVQIPIPLNNKILKRAFTLIELLVVISIIGALTTLLMVNFLAARERARDALRKGDFRNIQTALRLYYNDNGKYPDSNASFQILGCGPKTARTACAWGAAWATSEGNTYMGVLPDEPLDTPDYRYTYFPTTGDYTLEACLENKSDPKGVSGAAWCSSTYAYKVIP